MFQQLAGIAPQQSFKIFAGSMRKLYRGRPPFPCDTEWSFKAKAYVKFDMAHLASILRSSARVRALDEAFLIFQKKRSVNISCRGGRPDERIATAQNDWTTLGLTFRDEGGIRETIRSREIFDTSSDELRRVDVSDDIRAWIQGSSTNHGFVLHPKAILGSGLGLSFGPDPIRACGDYYGDFELHLSFRNES